MSTPESLGARLRALREKRGLSQKDAAASARLSRSYLSGLENDLVRPGLGALTRLAGLYGVGLEDLVPAPLSLSGAPDESPDEWPWYPGLVRRQGRTALTPRSSVHPLGGVDAPSDDPATRFLLMLWSKLTEAQKMSIIAQLIGLVGEPPKEPGPASE